MTRKEMVGKLLNEGISRQTLVNLSDKQMSILYSRMIGEATTTVTKTTKYSPAEIKGKGIKVDGTVTFNPDNTVSVTNDSMKEGDIAEGKKKPTQKQLSALDKNKNGKIDKEDFKLLRSKKKSSKEEVKEGEKWIQKAIHPSKKGSLKKALGVKKDETIPAGKLKSAAKKGGKTGQRARLAMTLKKLKENTEVKNWVENIVESNYHPFTSKSEIMELIKTKLNEVETAAIPMPATKAKKGHNGVPEFMTYDAIMGSSETKKKPAPTETPVREKPTPTPGGKPGPKKPSYIPGPGPDHKPKALSEKKSLKNGNK
jgi:hypothetical protein